MNVWHAAPGVSPVPVAGPGDLNPAGPGSTVTILDGPADGREGALWAPAIGLAVMRGASVRRAA